MAFEQTQQTRVESKQWSGDWAKAIAPSGNAGDASKPYWSESQAIDFEPLAKSIDRVTDIVQAENKKNASAARDARGGEFLNRAYDIVSLNTDANGVLSAKGEENMRNLRLQMGREGYNDVEIQRVMKAVGQDYESTMQGMLQIEQRKHSVEQEKALAQKAVELYPELTGRTLAEQAEVGRNYYRNMNLLSASLEAASNPNQSPEVHDAAISQAAETFTSLIGTEKLNLVLTQELNAEDEMEMANQITNSLIQGGIVQNVREARALGTELSASFVGKARENREKMEKLTIDEKERYIKLQELNAKTGLMKNDPELAAKLALVNWDFTKLPSAYIDLITDRFDAAKIAGDGDTHYWQGAFDAQTANFCVQNGTPCVADAGQQAMVEEGLKMGDAQSADQVYQSLMSDNMFDVLNAPAMEKQREGSVAAYKERLAGLLVNELRPHILSTTGYVAGNKNFATAKAVDVGFWDSSSKINPIMNKWKKAMRHIGMSEEEIVETGVNAMKALGVKVPENTTNPDAFYEDSTKNIRNYLLEHPIRSAIGGPFNPATAANARMTSAYADYKAGNISAEEAIARMAASMGGIGSDEDDGYTNIDLVNELTTPTIENAVDMDDLEERVRSSEEFKRKIEEIATNPNLQTPEQKAEEANKAFQVLKELFGVKSAEAKPAYADINKSYATGETTPEGYHIVRGDIQPAFIKNVNKRKTTKKVDAGGRTNEKLKNMVTRIIYEEARSEGKMGMYLVATAMWNRTKAKGEKDKGNPSRLADVIRKNSAFEPVSKDPTYYMRGNSKIIKRPKKEADAMAWDYCEQLADAMINDNFVPAGNFTGFINEKISKNKGSDFQAEKQITPDLEVYSFGNHLFYKQPSYKRYAGFRQTGT